MNEIQCELARLFDEATNKLDQARSPSDIEVEMAAFLDTVRAHPEERGFVVTLFKRALFRRVCPWEFVEYCLHDLRWPEMHDFIREIGTKEFERLGGRASRVWEHLLEAFRDDWDMAEGYLRYQKPQGNS